MTSSQKLNELINNNKSFEEKRLIGFKEDVSASACAFPKFSKSTFLNPKLKCHYCPKRYVNCCVWAILLNKVNTLLIDSSFHRTNNGLFPQLTRFSPIFHHYGKYGHLRSCYGKLIMLLFFLLPLLRVPLSWVKYLDSLTQYISTIYMALLATILGSVLDIFGVPQKVIHLTLIPLSSKDITIMVHLSMFLLDVLCTKGMVWNGLNLLPNFTWLNIYRLLNWFFENLKIKYFSSATYITCLCESKIAFWCYSSLQILLNGSM